MAVADTTAPTLTALTVPGVVDVTNGEAVGQFAIGARDADSGVSNAYIQLDRPFVDANGNSTSYLSFYADTDSFEDGMSTLAQGFGRASDAGTYAIVTVSIYDRANNYAYYTADQLRALGFATSFTIGAGSAADTTPPALAGLSVTATVDVTNGTAFGVFSLSATDAGSGIASAAIRLDRPFVDANGNATDLLTFDADGTTPDGELRLAQAFAASSAAESYRIVSVSIADRAGNRSTFTADQLQARGYATGFDVRNGSTNAIAGSDAADTITGSPRDDVIAARAGNDTILASGGSDHVDGGDGTDTMEYDRYYRTYAVAAAGYQATVTKDAGQVDTLASIEMVRFADGVLTFDPDSSAAKVMRLYDTVLARTPDAGGLDAWSDALDAGVSLTQVAQGFLTSDEFQRATGSLSNADYVEYLYNHALGRVSDPGGKAVWTGALDAGIGRADILVGFSESAEHRGLTADTLGHGLFVTDNVHQQVAALYDSFADRRPDQGGLEMWVGAIRSGARTLAQVADGFADSVEFHTRTDGLSNAALVEFMYRNTLDRGSDPGGQAYWTGRLDAGMTRGDLILTFAESAEHLQLMAPDIQNGIALG